MPLSDQILLGSPALVLCAGAILLMVLEVTVRSAWSRAGVTGLFIVAALVMVLLQTSKFTAGLAIFGGFLYADPFAMFFTVLILGGALLALLLGMSHLASEGIDSDSEFYALFLMCTAGAIWFATSAEFIMLFLSLEIMSMALYCLCGSATGIRRSAEAALKYFFLGSFSSAFLLYGIALLYGLTGTTQIAELAVYLGTRSDVLLYLAMGMVIVGLVFKIAIVPFHFWAPDVYEGAPTPVTAYMACVVKASAVAVALRVMWSSFGELVLFWSGIIWTLAALTMFIGNIIALKQRSLKRMLAYSSIAHAGYILVAFLAPGQDYGGGPAVLFYLVSYTIMTLGAFGVVLAVTSKYSAEKFPDDISMFNGLGVSRPFLGATMAIFLLSLAGIPPGMAGLLGKFYVFSSAIKAGYVGLAVIGVLSSAISCYYYLRVIVAMYFVEPAESPAGMKIEQVLALPLKGVLVLCTAGVVFLGLIPGPLYALAARVMRTF